MTELGKKSPLSDVRGVNCASCGKPIPMFTGPGKEEGKGSIGATCPHCGAKHTYGVSDLK
jgi:hypothetical protein